jgi:hypothetical protein
MHRVLHWAPIKISNRVYESFLPHPGIEQAIVSSGGSYGLPKVFGCSAANPSIGIEKAISKFKPTVLTQCDLSKHTIPLTKKHKLKHVFINHGFWPKSPNNMGRYKDKFWEKFDLFCGATSTLEEIFEKSTKKMNIATNALPQFDVLYNKTRKPNIVKKRLMERYGVPNADAVITFFGNIKERVSLIPFNRGYYETAIELGEIARKNNWLVLIKTKTDEPDRYLAKCKKDWVGSVKKKYNQLKSNRNVKFVAVQSSPYELFCSDVIINSARSTVDVETALIRRPLIRVWAHQQELDDITMSYESGVLDFDAAHLLKDTKNLEDMIKDCISDNKLASQQEEFIDSLGIIFDGKAYTRVLDAIKRL